MSQNQKEREKLQSLIDAWLDKGNKITKLDPKGKPKVPTTKPRGNF